MCTAVLAALPVGCGGPVEIDSADLSDEAQEACQELLGLVPYELGGLRPRETDPADALGAAWGDPAVELRCVVDMPEGFDEASDCEVVNGVGWYVPAEALSDPDADVTIATYGWEPVVELRIPGEHRPPNEILVQLAEPVKESLARVRSCV